MNPQPQVLIVGAGPVGLLTAIELTLGGVHVLVLERLPAPATASKALMIGPLGSEALARRGLSAPLEAAESSSFAAIRGFLAQNGVDLQDRSRFIGHFAGLTLIRKDAQREPDRRGRILAQPTAEAMLAERAHALGIEVRRGCELTALSQQEDGVAVEWASPSGPGRLHCAFLVGCDGGRSTVRKLAGFAFPGTPPTMTLYTAGSVTVDHPERLLPVGWRRTPAGVFAYGPFPGRLFMLDFSGPPADRQAPVTPAEFEEVLRRVSGADVRVTALEQGSRWTDNTRLADSYRRGRVLLAGDAAHVHSPFGGQGMSLGLVDAANLGWKLAAVVRGDLPDALLDTYTAERRPVAEAVLANTLAQAAIMRPDPKSGAMRELVASLLELDDVNRRIGGMITGLALRYDLGSTHDAVGRLVADRPIPSDNGTSSLYALMQAGTGVLLDASPDGAISRLVRVSTDNLRCVAVDSGASMLIRPDACIAWAADGSSTDGLQEALRRWFPTPGVQPRTPRAGCAPA